MSLLNILGLASVQTLASPSPPVGEKPTGGSAEGKAGSSTRPKTRGKDHQVDDGVSLGEPTTVIAPKLGWVGVNGKERQVFGFTDTEGTLVRGGSSKPFRALSELNAYAMRGVELVVEMQELDDAWRADIDRVRQSAKAGAVQVEALEKALPAMTRRMGKDSDFFNDVNGYLTAFEAAKAFPDRIQALAHGIEQARLTLVAVVADKAKDAAEQAARAVAGAVAAKEAEIKAANEMFKIAFDIALKVAAFKWQEIADKAFALASEKAFNEAASLGLEQLKTQLAKAKAKVQQIADQAYAARIEAAREGLASVVGDMKTIQGEFASALRQLASRQANAQNELGESGDTAVVGKMVGARARQIADVARSRASCGLYASVADKGKAKVMKIGEIFGKVGAFLDESAKIDPAFDRSKPYATSIELSALTNSKTFYDWTDSVSTSKAACKAALDWLNSDDDASPMAAYESVLKVVGDGISRPR